MPTSSFPEYARKVQAAIDELIATGEARLVDLEIDSRSRLRGFIAGVLQFQNDTELHFREFVDVSQSDSRLMYAYHYQDDQKKLIFRYDNAPHRPALPQLDHKHTSARIEPANAPTFGQVLDEILLLSDELE
jgi:hypothetical protein